jgi:hypothetical protein
MSSINFEGKRDKEKTKGVGDIALAPPQVALIRKEQHNTFNYMAESSFCLLEHAA